MSTFIGQCNRDTTSALNQNFAGIFRTTSNFMAISSVNSRGLYL